MDLYRLPAGTPAPPPPADPDAPRGYWEALRDEGQVELIHDPADPAQAPLGYAAPVVETRAGREVAVAYALGTPEERAAERLRQWRETAVLGPFEARAALLATGQLTAVEALMADPATPDLVRLAWTTSTVFPRTSPAIAVLGAALGWSEAQLDALFQAGATPHVMAQLAAAVPAPAPETPPEPPPAEPPADDPPADPECVGYAERTLLESPV
jgi:hypothetical protein